MHYIYTVTTSPARCVVHGERADVHLEHSDTTKAQLYTPLNGLKGESLSNIVVTRQLHGFCGSVKALLLVEGTASVAAIEVLLESLESVFIVAGDSMMSRLRFAGSRWLLVGRGALSISSSSLEISRMSRLRFGGSCWLLVGREHTFLRETVDWITLFLVDPADDGPNHWLQPVQTRHGPKHWPHTLAK